jgi:hypothetical protein
MATISGRLVYRPATGWALALCYAGFTAWWLAAGLTGGGRPGLSWTALAWLLVVGAAIYAVFWRPAVIVDDDGVLLLNVLRDVRVPWAALEAVETRYALTLVTAEHRYASWAAGAPGRGSGLARLGHSRGRGTGRRNREGDLAGVGEAWGDLAGVGEAGGGEAGHLTRADRAPGVLNPDRSSRNLRTDSGAAAFMVEQAWAGWRERPRARAESGTPVPRVGVAWNLPVVAGLLLLVFLALIAGAFQV